MVLVGPHRAPQGMVRWPLAWQGRAWQRPQQGAGLPARLTCAFHGVWLHVCRRHKEFLRHIKREYARLVALLQAYALIRCGQHVCLAHCLGLGRRMATGPACAVPLGMHLRASRSARLAPVPPQQPPRHARLPAEQHRRAPGVHEPGWQRGAHHRGQHAERAQRQVTGGWLGTACGVPLSQSCNDSSSLQRGRSALNESHCRVWMLDFPTARMLTWPAATLMCTCCFPCAPACPRRDNILAVFGGKAAEGMEPLEVGR